jgi:hypothetical protein
MQFGGARARARHLQGAAREEGTAPLGARRLAEEDEEKEEGEGGRRR